MASTEAPGAFHEAVTTQQLEIAEARRAECERRQADREPEPELERR